MYGCVSGCDAKLVKSIAQERNGLYFQNGYVDLLHKDKEPYYFVEGRRSCDDIAEVKRNNKTLYHTKVK